jgi:hypothetical protein
MVPPKSIIFYGLYLNGAMLFDCSDEITVKNQLLFCEFAIFHMVKVD